MIDGLRAAKLKPKEIKDNFFILEKNKPKQINFEHNDVILLIKEEETNEELFIHSSFAGDEFAIIGKEYCLNFKNDPPKVDLTYIFMTKEKEAIIYLYDMKKTFAGIDVILKLIEQWKSSISTAEYCMEQLDGYEIAMINIGVITENDDIERRNREINHIFSKAEVPQKMSSFMKSKYLADNAEYFKKAQILTGFLDGQVTIRNCTYNYDIKIFTEKKFDMFFDNGIIRKI